MGRVGGDIRKERLAAFDGFDPAEGLAEKQVSAITVRFFENTVVENGWIEIGVARSVAT